MGLIGGIVVNVLKGFAIESIYKILTTSKIAHTILNEATNRLEEVADLLEEVDTNMKEEKYEISMQ